ncbi:MAG: hypothetical protein QXW20_08885 [Ignisphaera sp.]
MDDERLGVEKFVYGIKITRDDEEELLNLLTKMLRIVYDYSNIYVDFVAITSDNIYIQWHFNAVDPCGNTIGTTYRYEKLDELIRKFKEIKLPQRNELIHRLKEIVNSID